MPACEVTKEEKGNDAYTSLHDPMIILMVISGCLYPGVICTG